MRNLYIQQKVFKIMDHYPIRDEADNIVYQVDQEFQLIGKTVHVSDVTGNRLFTVRREILTLLPRFVVELADGRELLLQSKLSFFYKVIEVEPTDFGITIEGDFFSKEFEVLRDGNPIGRISRKWLSFGDKFAIEVLDEEQEELFVAIMIALDSIIDAEQS